MGCADVCIDMDYDGSNEFFTSKVVTARKEHTCGECGEKIPRGAKYEYASGKTDGDFFDAKTCALCVEVRQAFVCGSYVFGELWDAIREEIFPRWKEAGPWDCLAKLKTEEARAVMNTKYAAWEKDQDDE